MTILLEVEVSSALSVHTQLKHHGLNPGVVEKCLISIYLYLVQFILSITSRNEKLSYFFYLKYIAPPPPNLYSFICVIKEEKPAKFAHILREMRF